VALALLLEGSGGGSPATTEQAAEQHNRGIAAFSDRRLAEAEAAFRAALGASPPGAAETRYNLALTLSRSQRSAEALSTLDTLAHLPRAEVLRAQILQSMGRRDEAVEVWLRARQTGALDAASLWHLVQLLKWAGRSPELIEVLDDLGRRGGGDPTLTPSLEVERAEALARSERWPEALAALRQAVRVLAPAEARVGAAVREAEATLAHGATRETRTRISMAANLLRSTAGFQQATAALAERSDASPLSEAPLPWADRLAPGPPPSPVPPSQLIVPASGLRGVCVSGDDLVLVGDRGVAWFSPVEGGAWRPGKALPTAGRDCAAADLDKDGTRELLVLTAEAASVVWADGEPERLPGQALAAVVFDYDLEGDADLALVEARRLRLWRNGRDRTFTEASDAAGLGKALTATALGAVAADLTGDGAAELIVARADGPLQVIAGLQRERAQARPGPPGSSGPVAVADLDRDGDLDLVGAGFALLNDGLGRLGAEPLPQTSGAARLGAADFDLDGFADLVLLGPDGRLTLLRGSGALAFAAWPGGRWEGVRDVAVADLDRDGALDVALATERGVELARPAEGGTGIALEVAGTKDNADGIGTRVQLLAGELQAVREMRLGTFDLGEAGPRLVLPLGGRREAQWIKVVWPNRTWSSVERGVPGPVRVEQPESLVASCPFLYAWNGTRFAFLTDLLGGSPLGLPLSRDRSMPIDPEEYVLLPRGLLAARDGSLELRTAVELREMLFLDHAELLAVDHPEGSIVATADGLGPPPFPPFRLYASESARPPAAAVDHRGADVLRLLTRVDRRYPDAFRPLAFQGYAEPQSLTLDFAPPARAQAAFLVVTGGYYWSEADNLGLSQARRVRAELPRLEAFRDGRWIALLDPMPFPGGRPKTIAIDLGGALGAGPVRLRISTNLRLYFDQILLASQDLPPTALGLRRLGPERAELRFRGYSSEGPFDGRVPPSFDYEGLRPARPYPGIEGFYTRFGDVRELLRWPDNAAVIAHHGEEIALAFRALPAAPPGQERSFFLHTVGWDKDGNPNTATGTTVEPLPFLGMSRYPYQLPEAYPWTPELEEVHRRYQTRWVGGR
jgi:tetratricopeptide (TPR) repeat protein